MQLLQLPSDPSDFNAAKVAIIECLRKNLPSSAPDLADVELARIPSISAAERPWRTAYVGTPLASKIRRPAAPVGTFRQQRPAIEQLTIFGRQSPLKRPAAADLSSDEPQAAPPQKKLPP